MSAGYSAKNQACKIFCCKKSEGHKSTLRRISGTRHSTFCTANIFHASSLKSPRNTYLVLACFFRLVQGNVRILMQTFIGFRVLGIDGNAHAKSNLPRPSSAGTSTWGSCGFKPLKLFPSIPLYSTVNIPAQKPQTRLRLFCRLRCHNQKQNSISSRLL